MKNDIIRLVSMKPEQQKELNNFILYGFQRIPGTWMPEASEYILESKFPSLINPYQWIPVSILDIFLDNTDDEGNLNQFMLDKLKSWRIISGKIMITLFPADQETLGHRHSTRSIVPPKRFADEQFVPGANNQYTKNRKIDRYDPDY
jgi:hypothetical protein